MKIIDLLNKIANGEEVPKKIYCFNREFYLEGNTYFGDTFTLMHYIQEEDLNDKVEVLEEEKKIPEKSKIDFNTKLPVSGCSENEAFMMTCISHLGNTMDKIIDYLKSKGE